MKLSRNWLKLYFDKDIPSADELADLFTFHAFEVEGIEKVGEGKKEDYVIDAKVLPDRAHYALSHEGIAGEVSVLTKQPMKPSQVKETLGSIDTKPVISIENKNFCRRYIGRYVENISVSNTPDWIKDLIVAIGQRSINTIVDATNLVMFDCGQPLHAFDADKVKGNIVVRPAKEGEKIILLDDKEITLLTSDFVIADDEGPLAIAGVKGGKRAEVSASTKRLIIESANFEPSAVRRTSTKYNLRSESSKRYENEITAELAKQGMDQVCMVIKELNPDAKFGPVVDEYPVKATQTVIEFNPAYIEERLGVKVPLDEAKNILQSMGIVIEEKKDKWNLIIPFKRLDLTIPEDIIEEVGRVYGYDKIEGILPPKADKPAAVLPMHFLIEKIRNILAGQGFSEVNLYTLVSKGEVETAYPLAKDKAFLRKNLTEGLNAALERNALNADLLGLDTIRIFEIGNVFPKEGEHTSLSIGIRTLKKKQEKAKDQIKKVRDELLKELGVDAVVLCSLDDTGGLITVNGKTIGATNNTDGVLEMDLSELVKSFRGDTSAIGDTSYKPASTNKYQKFSLYPFIVRDAAVFVPEGIEADQVWQTIKKGIADAKAESLLAKHSLFDTFKKDGKVSFAFRMVFQSMDKTLTDEEVSKVMEKVYGELKGNGWEVR